MDVFGSVKNAQTWNVPGTPHGYQAWKPTPKAPTQPKPMQMGPAKPAIPSVTPQYPFGGASAVPNTGKQGFMDKLLGSFGGNKIASSLETNPATSWIYGKGQQPSTAPEPQGGGISLQNPFGINKAEASDGGTPTQTQETTPTSGDEWSTANAFGGGTKTSPTGQNGASASNSYVDFLKSYQSGMRNIENQAIPLEDITGEQEHMRKLYGDELTARAALSKDGGSDGLLSISEAKELGVPYGTTKAQAISMGRTPGQAGGGGSDIAKEALSVISNIMGNTTGFNTAVGIADILPNIPGTAASDFRNDVSRLKALLTLDNLKLLKGAMSDKDLAFLLSVGTSLNTNMSKEAFNKELANIQQKLQTANFGGGSSTGGMSTGGGQVGVGLF